MATRADIKNWFKKGLIPSESHFAAWIDSFFHKDDKIPYASVAGLDDALADKVSKAVLQNTQIENTKRFETIEDSIQKITPNVIVVSSYTESNITFETSLSDIKDILYDQIYGGKETPLIIVGEGLLVAASTTRTNSVDDGEWLVFTFDVGDGTYKINVAETSDLMITSYTKKSSPTIIPFHNGEEYAINIDSYYFAGHGVAQIWVCPAEADGTFPNTNVQAGYITQIQSQYSDGEEWGEFISQTLYADNGIYYRCQKDYDIAAPLDGIAWAKIG